MQKITLNAGDSADETIITVRIPTRYVGAMLKVAEAFVGEDEPRLSCVCADPLPRSGN